ncbi:rhomboid family GlyGly-CTERM serine protease [Alteromonadaceae bacterium Bs31]|nr:rhomboid family GlyGly-CTERM serine protease [Alteromonadaceae bacterium Bs31]
MSYPQPMHGSSSIAAFQFVAFLSLVLLLGLAGEWLNALLLYQREAILQGQIWRLLSGHVVHLGWMHTVMNILALSLVVWLFRGALSKASWCIGGSLISLSISISFLALKPHLSYYGGLSGTIHGLITMACIGCLVKDAILPRWQAAVVLLLLFAKLFYEHTPWYNSDFLQEAMDAPVIIDAHLYGAIAGLVIGSLTSLKVIVKNLV